MAFMNFELNALAKAFPNQAADLEGDFDDEELRAIDDVGVLKGNPHIYLGKIILKFRIVFINTFLRLLSPQIRRF